ncbi:hypothetical protein BFO_2718 [Tannerella forsythia 92A2]|jgi:hypothetical protein|uniref:Uncharacterized protein n=1 Tax=Tannerella forsythia (strain ATCC 43037 / JCM 10827 / CCUG 21028 A / KCTC 5666 / FDC 338) TaxID=203275 RepID=G8UMC2_TANFA|nr:hypothetical protein BFO_2718 [Tannerella forsythia 92A2]
MKLMKQVEMPLKQTKIEKTKQTVQTHSRQNKVKIQPK